MTWAAVAECVREAGGRRFAGPESWTRNSPAPDLGCARYFFSWPLLDPYFYHEDEIVKIASITEKWHVSIHANGWWNPGHTLRIEFRRRTG